VDLAVAPDPHRHGGKVRRIGRGWRLRLASARPTRYRPATATLVADASPVACVDRPLEET
jgi:hypothetical protein